MGRNNLANKVSDPESLWSSEKEEELQGENRNSRSSASWNLEKSQVVAIASFRTSEISLLWFFHFLDELLYKSKFWTLLRQILNNQNAEYSVN